MDKLTAQRLGGALMHQHGLVVQCWHFKLDKAKTRCGICYHSLRTIALSTDYVTLNSEELIRDTILHEIAHALRGPEHGHDIVWEMKAKSIGSSGQRCKSENEVIVATAPWEAVCPGCNRTCHAYRRPKTPRSCGVCNPGHYDTRFLLTYHKT